MQAWLSEASEAHKLRVPRRRPIKVAVGLALLVGWGLVAMLDALFRVRSRSTCGRVWASSAPD